MKRIISRSRILVSHKPGSGGRKKEICKIYAKISNRDNKEFWKEVIFKRLHYFKCADQRPE